MCEVNPALLWPTMAMTGVIFGVWFVLMRQRLAHVARNTPTAADFADADAVGRYFRRVERPARNLANLFEMPMLYFALVPLLLMTGKASGPQVALAWIFVALRLMHSLVHIGPNRILVRFRLYLASCVALSGMWLGFVLDMVGAAT